MRQSRGARAFVGIVVLVAAAVALAMVAAEPSSRAWRERLREGELELESGRRGAAAQDLRAAQARALDEFPVEDPRLDETFDALASLYIARGEPREVEALYLRLLSLRDPLGANHPAVARVLDRLGRHYLHLGKYAPAESAYRRALRIREHTLGPQHADTARTLLRLVELYRLQGRGAEADETHVRAVQALRAALGPGHPEVVAAERR